MPRGLQRFRLKERVLHRAHVDIPALTIRRGRAGHIDHRAEPGIEILIDQAQLEYPLVWIYRDPRVRHWSITVCVKRGDCLPEFPGAIVKIGSGNEPSFLLD